MVRNWIRYGPLHRDARSFFPETALCDSGVAGERFRKALAVARDAYRGMQRDAADIRDFVHPAWEENIREVERYFLTDFDMAFLNHPRINGTMVFTDRNAHTEERLLIETWRSPDFLRKVIGNGLNAPFLEGKLTIANALNSVHHLYHLARFERFRGEPVEKIRSVVEFGGGYGNMARLFRNFGNLAQYVIIDLPLFCCIQFVFLATVEGPGTVRLFRDPGASYADGTILLLPITSLKKAHFEGELFLSTWALSECPITAYDYIRGMGWFGAEELLVSHHDNWKPWDSEQLLSDLRATFERVVVEPLTFLPGNQYIHAGKRIGQRVP